LKRRRESRDRRDREENYTATNPILRRQRNHNDYFTLTSNTSDEDMGPLLIPPTSLGASVYRAASPIPTGTIRSQSTQSAVSARSTTGYIHSFYDQIIFIKKCIPILLYFKVFKRLKNSLLECPNNSG